MVVAFGAMTTQQVDKQDSQLTDATERQTVALEAIAFVAKTMLVLTLIGLVLCLIAVFGS